MARFNTHDEAKQAIQTAQKALGDALDGVEATYVYAPEVEMAKALRALQDARRAVDLAVQKVARIQAQTAARNEQRTLARSVGVATR